MFVDASALVAIMTNEADREVLESRLIASSSQRLTSPIVVFEATLALSRKLRLPLANAEAEVLDYVETFIDIVPITVEIGRLALDARARYGKGTGHPAQLNMGDCFAYACAKAHAAPLLYKGDDFVHTDLA